MRSMVPPKSGTSIQAVVNAPIVDDRLAVRVNAYDSYTPGYIDNAYTGAEDVNDLRRNGGRIAALWRSSDLLSMKVTAFWNRLSADSLPEYRPPELAPCRTQAMPTSSTHRDPLVT